MVALPNGSDGHHGFLSDLAHLLGVDVGQLHQVNHLQHNPLHPAKQTEVPGHPHLGKPYEAPHLNMQTRSLQHFNDDLKTKHNGGHAGDESWGQTPSKVSQAFGGFAGASAAPSGLAQAFGGFEGAAAAQSQAFGSHAGGTHDSASSAFGVQQEQAGGAQQAWSQRAVHGIQVMESARSCLTNHPSYTVTQDGKHIYRHDPDGSEHDVGYMFGNVYKNRSINELTYLKDGKLYECRTDEYLGKWVGGIMFDRHGVEIGHADTAAEFGAYVTFGVRGGIG